MIGHRIWVRELEAIFNGFYYIHIVIGFTIEEFLLRFGAFRQQFRARPDGKGVPTLHDLHVFLRS
jgi:hypothetical protein